MSILSFLYNKRDCAILPPLRIMSAEAMNKNDDKEDDDMIRYTTIDDVPGWARSTIKEMMDAPVRAAEDSI